MSEEEIRKLAAIMFTDMVGYSALSQRDGKLALQLLEEHRELLRKIFPQFNGTEIKTIGDAFLVEFQSALEAAECAISIQRTLAHRNADAPSDRQIQVKIGIHIGDVVHRGGDVYGDGVNIASRIEPLAGAGGICVSMDVERQIRNALETRFEKLAPTELKNISVPMELFRIVLPWESAARVGKSEIGPCPGGVKSEVGRKKRGFPISALVLVGILAVAALAFGWWWMTHLRKNAIATSPSPGSLQPQNIPEKSIAVLPFENLSEDKSNAFFADGVQDEILTDLSKVADLKVISRTSVMQYRNAAARNLREIGQQLGVAHVLEGSVQRAANKIRINAQLIDARDDAHLWAQTYDKDVADIFAIQSEIAQTIAEQLKAKLSPSEKAAIAQAPTKDVVANDLFVRALALDAMSNDPSAKSSLLQAVSLLEEAIRRDPNFLLAKCLLSQVHSDLYWDGFDHTPARLEMSRVVLEEAEKQNPDAPEVHFQKGIYAYHASRDYTKAREELEIAGKTLRNVDFLLGIIDRRQSRWDEAIKHLDRAVELDPRNFIVLEETAFTYDALNQFDRAKELLQRAVEVSPTDYFARLQLALNSYYTDGDLSAFRAVLQQLRGEGAEATANASQFFVMCAMLDRDHAAALQALNFIPPDGTVNPVNNFLVPREWFVGLVARTFGDSAEAQRAFTAARANVASTVQAQPDYAPAWSTLGLIDAGLGRKADAVAEGKRACELLPVSKDSWEAPTYVKTLAVSYAWLGENDAALKLLETTAKERSNLTYGDFKLDPIWDPLRKDLRFEKIVQSFAPKKQH